MDSATAVNTSAAISLLGFAAIIFLLLFLIARWKWHVFFALLIPILLFGICLLYTSPSPRDLSTSRMPSSA